MEHIDEIFGTPINDLPKANLNNSTGWKIGLGLGILVLVGVGVYYYIDKKINNTKDEINGR